MRAEFKLWTLCDTRIITKLSKMCVKMWALLLLQLLPYCIDGSGLPDQLAEVTQKCCNQGVSYARNHTSQDCSSSVAPDVPSAFGNLCIFAMDGCCKDFFEKSRDCEDGIKGVTNNCNGLKSESAKNCCNECRRGKVEAQNGASCNITTTAIGADYSLANDAFVECCKESFIEALKEPRRSSKPEIVNTKKSEIDFSSVCEEYAPNELCAHHCIPIPGSYRCECNPGFKLMADQRNCIEIQKNRCKPHNHCEHKCNDNGYEVKCSCRRGYKLQADGKSCRDIDECTLEPSVCLPGTNCQNIQGSYKCIPMKKSHEKGQCPAGYNRNPQNNFCDDIDECLLPNPPCPRYTCVNTVGGYTCGGNQGDPSKLAKVPTQQEDRCPPGFKAGVNEECEDVDECAIERDDCNRLSQFCINTRGSFHCQDKSSKHCLPGFQISADNNRCEDIDECEDSHALCKADQVCVNVPGAYDCKSKSEYSKSKTKCADGFRIKPNGRMCEDVDECKEGTHLCDLHQSCLNTNGSHECRCMLGFELDPMTGACIDINECASDQNNCIPESQRCDNTVGSYLCIRFTSCGTGYTLHHSTGECEDIDECAHGTDNCARAGHDYICMNMPGSFRCVKKPSTTSPPEYEYEYYDSEEDTGANQTLPKPPFTDRPTTTEVPIRSTKISLLYKTTEKQEDVEESKQQTNPENSYDVQKNAENPAPIPNQEETLYPEQPNELDKTNQLPKSDISEVLVTVKPLNESATVKGVQGNDGDIVLETQDIPKDTWTKVAKEPELASCQAGFERNINDSCIDIDECYTGKHICSGLTETCRNTIGGYVCECAPGFRRELATGACDLITASSTTSTTTEPPPSEKVPVTPRAPSQWYNWGYQPYQPPQTRPFKPRNMCDVGYHMNSQTRTCEDIDECNNGLANCAAVEVCVNTPGGYRCECHPNWTLDVTRHRCIPARDPAKFPTGYGNVPYPQGIDSSKVSSVDSKHDMPGHKYIEPTLTSLGDRGDVLSCPWGYRLGDDNVCIDIDECSNGAANCGPMQLCSNLPGGYTCYCPVGHKLVGESSCEDVDECALQGSRPICSEHADCVNTVGSYHCRCHEGFRSAPANDKVCMDVDECTESRVGALCEHRCNNVWGGYRCSCHRGYRLGPDNRTCADINECQEFVSKNICIGRCHNEPGSYRCSCPPGYRLSEDKRSCIDIDECETGEAPCANGGVSSGVSDFCFNTRGGYRCQRITCPPGYRLENKHRCTIIDRACPVTDWDCIHRPSTYSYNYITFASKLYIPSAKVDLFTLRGPSWPNAKMKFELRLNDVNAPPTVKNKADINAFMLVQTGHQAVVTLVQSLEGPQSIELELSMELHSGDLFGGIAVAKLFIYVSEYEF